MQSRQGAGSAMEAASSVAQNVAKDVAERFAMDSANTLKGNPGMQPTILASTPTSSAIRQGLVGDYPPACLRDNRWYPVGISKSAQ